MGSRTCSSSRLLTVLVTCALVAGTGVACGPSPSPPLGEALIIVDTDAPVPGFASRLRVDVYTADGGTWYSSRDVARPRAADWPFSFGVYAPDLGHDRVALVRLRGYPEGKVRDYRGERFAARPSSGPPFGFPAAPPPTDQPRLLDTNGNDITPPSEPQPMLAVDRLLLVRVRPGVRGAVRVVLRGACVGTMADLTGMQTCTDTENQRLPVGEVALDPNMTLPAQSLAGSFGAPAPCTITPRPPGKAAGGTPLYDEEVCVPGGLFILGNDDGVTDLLDDLPERAAILPPFLMDRFEVTVARWRAAVAAGFVPPAGSIYANEGPSPTTNVVDASRSVCSWSVSAQGREAYAVNCVSWSGARAFCQSLGGDLPTEAQWEYAGAVASRPFRTRYPWGDTPSPTCAQVEFGRGSVMFRMDCNPDTMHFGPQPVDARSAPSGDVSVGLGLVNLLGGMTEWTRDAFADFNSYCWVMAPLESPACLVDGAPDYSLRGQMWASNTLDLSLDARDGDTPDSSSTEYGFRCVRPGVGP